jgi:hypothetical protein
MGIALMEAGLAWCDEALTALARPGATLPFAET